MVEAKGPAESILSVLEQTPIIMEKMLLGVSEETLRWKPAPERWSVSEVLGHLAGTEELFRERTRKMIEEDTPQLAPFDQNAAYAAGKYSGPGRENLKKFCHERDRSLSWLRYLPAGAISRPGVHGELGRITVDELWHEWAFHDLGHIRQIAELYRARAFYPRMGSFQKYYTVKP